MWGIAITWHPAAVAERTPVGRVLQRDAILGRHRQGTRRGEVRLGMRLAAAHLVADDRRRERSARKLADDRVGEPPPRHRHQRARDLLGAELGQQITCPGPPWNLAADAGDHAVEQLVDDLVDRQVDVSVLADVAGGFAQVAADDGVGVFVAPRSAVCFDELVLALDPVRLGVDQCAVEIPQDGGWSAGIHGGSVWRVAASDQWHPVASGGRGGEDQPILD